jgi:hypothetical protein
MLADLAPRDLQRPADSSSAQRLASDATRRSPGSSSQRDGATARSSAR